MNIRKIRTQYIIGEIISKHINVYYTVGDVYYFLEHIKNRKVRLNITYKTDIYSVLNTKIGDMCHALNVIKNSTKMTINL